MIVDGMVYVGSYDGNLYGLDLDDGEQVWAVGLGGSVGSPVYADGVIYVSINAGELFALRP
jgi:outer membrane protein assembly factor BamB